MLIHAHGISKSYRAGAVAALKPTSLSIRAGEFVAILGPSGSGKSTLMSLIGLLDRPSSGQLLMDGRDCAHLSQDELAHMRNRLIGFVFQAYHLLPRQTVLDNVELPLVYAGIRRAERHRRAAEALAAVRLSHRIDHFPTQLSGGEQQRAAIARAIVSQPTIILADEPTGALDSATGQEIIKILKAINRGGRTIVLVTHDAQIARHASRIMSIRDGAVVSDEPVSSSPMDTADQPWQRDAAA